MRDVRRGEVYSLSHLSRPPRVGLATDERGDGAQGVFVSDVRRDGDAKVYQLFRRRVGVSGFRGKND